MQRNKDAIQFQISCTKPQLCFHLTHSPRPQGTAAHRLAAHHNGFVPGWDQTPSKGGCGDRVRTWSSAAMGHTPPNKLLVSNAGRRKAKGRYEACSNCMFPQKWIICALHVVWVLIRISGITTYVTITVDPDGRYTKHTNCIDMLKEGGEVMDNSVQRVK